MICACEIILINPSEPSMIYEFSKLMKDFVFQNTIISDYLIEQKFTTPRLLNIFFYLACHILFLKKVPKRSHTPIIYILSENDKKYTYWPKYARISDIL